MASSDTIAPSGPVCAVDELGPLGFGRPLELVQESVAYILEGPVKTLLRCRAVFQLLVILDVSLQEGD